MIFDWQPEYSVGDAGIDALHQQVFQTARDLQAAVLAGQPTAEPLAALVSCTLAHFAAEETLMQTSDYPESVRHQARHQALAETLGACGQGQAVTVEAIQSVKDLVVRHLEEEDRPLAPLARHLASRALSRS